MHHTRLWPIPRARVPFCLPRLHPQHSIGKGKKRKDWSIVVKRKKKIPPPHQTNPFTSSSLYSIVLYSMGGLINSAKKRKRVEKEQGEKLLKTGPSIGTSNSSGVKKAKNSSKPQTKSPKKSPRAQPRSEQQTKGQGELNSDTDEDGDVQGSEGEDDTPTQDPQVFTDLKLSTEILNSISSMGLTELTSIQRKSMPLLLAGKDVSWKFSPPIFSQTLS